MSDPVDLVMGAGAGSLVLGLAFTAVKALGARTVAQADGQLSELRADVKQVLLELRTQAAHGEALRDRIERLETRCLAQHQER